MSEGSAHTVKFPIVTRLSSPAKSQDAAQKAGVPWAGTSALPRGLSTAPSFAAQTCVASSDEGNRATGEMIRKYYNRSRCVGWVFGDCSGALRRILCFVPLATWVPIFHPRAPWLAHMLCSVCLKGHCQVVVGVEAIRRSLVAPDPFSRLGGLGWAGGPIVSASRWACEAGAADRTKAALSEAACSPLCIFLISIPMCIFALAFLLQEGVSRFGSDRAAPAQASRFPCRVGVWLGGGIASLSQRDGDAGRGLVPRGEQGMLLRVGWGRCEQTRWCFSRLRRIHAHEISSMRMKASLSPNSFSLALLDTCNTPAQLACLATHAPACPLSTCRMQ